MLSVRKNFWGRKPGFDLGDVLHIGVNIAFVLGLVLTAPRWPLTFAAIALILLSKWRIFAVQPRFWIPNLKANMVDIVVGLSTVGLMHQASDSGFIWFWAVLYMVWLLIVKPRNTELWVSVQALWAQLLGLVVIFNIMPLVHRPVLIIAVTWLVCWSAARHFFSFYEEPHYRTLGIVWSFIMVQLIWTSLHWLQYFQIGRLNIAAAALIASVISLVVGSLYHSFKKGNMQLSVVIENVGFGLVLLGLILAIVPWTERI